MFLSPTQIEWINRERKHLIEIIESKPVYGLVGYIARLEAVKMTIALHNLELEKKTKKRQSEDVGEWAVAAMLALPT